MRQIMRSSLDYAAFAQLCGRSPIMRKIMLAHNRIIPRSLVYLSCVLCVRWQLVCIVVPNESDVAAFKDYTPSADEAPAAAPAADTAAAAAPSPAAPAASYPSHSLSMHSTHTQMHGHCLF